MPDTKMLDIDLGPSSLHPKVIIQNLAKNCTLNLHLTLPDAIFPDPSELLDKWPDRDWSVSPSIIDIERPLDPEEEHTVLELVDWSIEGELEIPLHARYLPPRDGGWEIAVPVKGNYRCGLDSLELDKEVTVRLPAAKPGYQIPVEIGTALVIWLGWAWVAWRIWSIIRSRTARIKTE